MRCLCQVSSYESSYICLYAQIPFVFKGFSSVVDDAVWNGRIFSRFFDAKSNGAANLAIDGSECIL